MRFNDELKTQIVNMLLLASKIHSTASKTSEATPSYALAQKRRSEAARALGEAIESGVSGSYFPENYKDVLREAQKLTGELEDVNLGELVEFKQVWVMQ